MYFVYLLKSLSCPDQLYVGYITNLDERLKRHNSGRCVTTNRFKPWELIVYIAFDQMDKAKDFEKYLKSHSGRIFTQKRLV